MRTARVERTTAETEIAVELNLDGEGTCRIDTGLGFLDHMLAQLGKHALIDLDLRARGDLHVDAHHTVEDTGIAVGQAVNQALGGRKGIRRYGHALLPMDETLTQVAIDLSNRPYLVWHVRFTRDKLGEIDTETFREWFQGFAQHAGATLHVRNLDGANNHHVVESCYKGLAHSLRDAAAVDPRAGGAVPSTKGSL